MIIRQLDSLKDMLDLYPVIAHMYPDMSFDSYSDILKERVENGYNMVAVFDGEDCVSAAGFWFGIRFYCDRFLQLDNMVTVPEFRDKGAGTMALEWIKSLAKKEGCKRILVDSYVENFDAHRFFLREGFVIRGYHLNYTVDDG